jgi:hypothetical protein
MKPAIICLAALVALPAHAQQPTTHYDVKTINFDLWCQEQANLPPDRCDKRLPDDETKFEAYRAKIEKYEIPYLRRRQNDQQFDRTVLHNDPVDNPIDKSTTAPSQTSSPTEQKPPP